MPFTDPSQPIQAYLTNQARQLVAGSFIGPIRFTLLGFSVGRGGYQMSNPTQLYPISQNETALYDPVYPDNVGGIAEFEEIEEPTETVRVFDCYLPATTLPSNADYGLGEIGIWAQITAVDTVNFPSVTLGEIFLYAIAHMPIRCKTNQEAYLLRPTISY